MRLCRDRTRLPTHVHPWSLPTPSPQSWARLGALQRIPGLPRHRHVDCKGRQRPRQAQHSCNGTPGDARRLATSWPPDAPTRSQLGSDQSTLCWLAGGKPTRDYVSRHAVRAREDYTSRRAARDRKEVVEGKPEEGPIRKTEEGPIRKPEQGPGGNPEEGRGGKPEEGHIRKQEEGRGRSTLALAPIAARP